MKNDGGPAFPVRYSNEVDGPTVMPTRGMALRDYFAAEALMGMMASRNPKSPRFRPDAVAEYVYAVADAMLKARNQ